MGVVAHWYDDAQTIIEFQFTGSWTLDDYDIARNECRRLLNTVDYPVDQVYNLSDASAPPKNLITKFWQVAMTSHANTSGLIVIVGSNRLTEMLANAVGRVVEMATAKFDVTYITDPDNITAQVNKRRTLHRA